ncbi:MAG: glycosyltransferase family 2 protein [Chitinispirillaceae bacterium]|nr:glycosyltransferase family 2 protein [Chitinispirillaceae bacterium]
MKLSIVIPLYNEEESVGPLVDAIVSSVGPAGVDYEIVFVDDGSTDHSFAALKQLHAQRPGCIRVFRLSRNFGKSAALSVGIGKARGEIIVTMDADLQDDPQAISAMIELIEGEWDLVSGWKKERHDPLLKKLPSKFWNAITALVSGLRLHDFNCGFKAYRAGVAKTLDIYGERHRYLPVLAHWDGYKVTEIPVPHHPRRYGKSKYHWLNRGIKGLFDLLTLLFLRKYMKNPMHFFGVLGILLAIAGSGVLAWFGVEWILTGHMRLRPLVLLSIGAIIMGIQFISIGLIGELIAHLGRHDTYPLRDALDHT